MYSYIYKYTNAQSVLLTQLANSFLAFYPENEILELD